jgi:hypothetical protein
MKTVIAKCQYCGADQKRFGLLAIPEVCTCRGANAAVRQGKIMLIIIAAFFVIFVVWVCSIPNLDATLDVMKSNTDQKLGRWSP